MCGGPSGSIGENEGKSDQSFNKKNHDSTNHTIQTSCARSVAGFFGGGGGGSSGGSGGAAGQLFLEGHDPCGELRSSDEGILAGGKSAALAAMGRDGPANAGGGGGDSDQLRSFGCGPRRCWICQAVQAG